MTTTTDRIRGQVAKILNERELIISRGANDGVEEGMTFAVLDPTASEVTDPATGEVLGALHRPKVNVRVTRVEPRLAFAKTFESEQVNLGGLGIDWTARRRAFDRILSVDRILTAPPRHETRTDTLRTDEPTWDDETIDRSIRTGDPVEQIMESDDGRHPAPASSTPTNEEEAAR